LTRTEASSYTYGDIVDVMPGNEDECPDGLAVVIHTEVTPTGIRLWVLSENSPDFDDSPWSVYNPPSKAQAPLCWVVGTQYVKGVDKPE